MNDGRGRAALAAALVLAGCATAGGGGPATRVETFPLVTLVVTSDRAEVERRCLTPLDSLRGARPLGCQLTQPYRHSGGGRAIQSVTIVRWADRVPSALAVEIEAHELCHAIATVQQVNPDPCHDDNRGFTRTRP